MHEVAALIVTRMKKKKISISSGDISNSSKKVQMFFLGGTISRVKFE